MGELGYAQLECSQHYILLFASRLALFACEPSEQSAHKITIERLNVANTHESSALLGLLLNWHSTSPGPPTKIWIITPADLQTDLVTCHGRGGILSHILKYILSVLYIIQVLDRMCVCCGVVWCGGHLSHKMGPWCLEEEVVMVMVVVTVVVMVVVVMMVEEEEEEEVVVVTAVMATAAAAAAVAAVAVGGLGR